MKPNWFLGFPLRAAPWLEALTPPPRGARVFAEDDVHITFAFLGAVSEKAAMAAWEVSLSLDISATVFPSGPIRAFGNPRNPSAWAVEPSGVDGLVAALALRNLALEAAQAPLDTRPPRPHATLVRPRRDASHDGHWQLANWAETQQLPDLPLVVDRLALFTWSEARRERLFSVVAERTLTPR